MSKAEASVEELVGMIQRGELRLPEMQRKYVWRSTRVRDLLDSLYRGYPSGAILLWETEEDVPLQDMAIAQQKNPYQSTRLLLDGQQRLTSLSAVICGEPVTVRNRTKPIEVLFNLDHPDALCTVTEVEEFGEDDDSEEDGAEDEMDSSLDELQARFNQMTFVVATKKLAGQRQWVRVSDVFRSDNDPALLKQAGITSFEDPNFERYSKRLARLREIKRYTYRMDILERKLSYEEVTEIFVRVNSLGAKLRSSDLALAQITAKWRTSLTEFEAFQSYCAATGFEFELGLYIRMLIAFATGQSRFLTVSTLSAQRLQNAWVDSRRGIEFALNFTKNNCGIASPALLSSPFILVTIAYLGHKWNYDIPTRQADLLRLWVLLSNAKGRYSRGSSETLLDQDLATLRDGGGPADMLDRLRQQVGRLEIVPEELEGRNQRSALFKTMFLAFHAAGAQDWKSNTRIALDHSGVQHRLQFHHIFPKAILRKSYPVREADDIANLCFIGGKTNRQISDKAPAMYFPEVAERCGTSAFDKQCIPTDGALLRVEDYKSFISRRREMVADCLNRFLRISETMGEIPAASDQRTLAAAY